MSNATYADKRKNPRWQRFKLEMHNLHGWLCCRCGEADVCLHLHHKQYLPGREPWEYPPELMETLCENCHAKEHGKDKPKEAPAEPPLRCVRCDARLHVADVAGRDGKNEPLCEKCCMDAEREHFDERS